VPCYRCGMRQTDPERGKSPWRRGVVHDQLVLICPACQESTDWTAELERCTKCRSAHLIRRLGQVECLDCGLVREPEAVPIPGSTPGLNPGLVPVGGPDAAGRPAAADRPAADRPAVDRPAAADSTLADEVGRALDRLLGRA
jgi:hypothetical protein